MREFSISGFGDPVTVKEVDLDGNLGCWDEKTGTIMVDKDSPEPGKHIVLIHEILHLAETALIQGGIIKDRIDHEFISNAAPMLLWSFVESGYYTGVSKEELGCFMEDELEKLEEDDGRN